MRRASHTHPENTTYGHESDVVRIYRLPAVASRSTVDHAQAVGDDNPQCPSPPEVEVTMSDTPKLEDSPTEDVPHLAERLDLLFRTVPRTPDSAKLHTSTSVVEARSEERRVGKARSRRAAQYR